MTDFENLLAIEAIKQLKARYFRFVDSKDWSGYLGLFAEDAISGPDNTSPGNDYCVADRRLRPS